MTNIELSQITQLLHNNSDKFYTDLSAHNCGFITDHKQLFSMYNLKKPTFLEHISKQVPHLLKEYVRFEGKLKTKIQSVDVYYNYELYEDNVISDDMVIEKMHLYARIVNNLSETLQEQFYTQLSIKNYTLILNFDLTVPIKYLKEEYLVLYINYMSDKPNFGDFLVDLNKGSFIIDNYKNISNEIIDIYIMRNITIINEQTTKSLLTIGLSVKSIIKYNPEFLPYIIPYINNVDEFRIMLDSITVKTSLKVVEKIINHFPLFKSTIEKRFEEIVKKGE